jgi:hypothetical protein
VFTADAHLQSGAAAAAKVDDPVESKPAAPDILILEAPVRAGVGCFRQQNKKEQVWEKREDGQ